MDFFIFYCYNLDSQYKRKEHNMGSNNLSNYLEEFLKTKTGLPFVELSVERVYDNNYHHNTLSTHTHYEIVYVQKGKATFDIEGEKVELLKKDFMIIRPHIPHRLIIDSEETCSFITLYFDFKKNDNSLVSLEEFLYSKEDENYGAFIRLSPAYKKEISDALNKITREMANSLPDSEFLCSLTVMEIFVWISRALKDEWEKTVNKSEEKMLNIIEISKRFIEENYNSDIGLENIANNVYLSPSHFARVFKKACGISPIQYLLKVRIEKSKELIEYTDTKISDIAYDVGFSSQQRYNDIFKKLTDMSPTEYRKKIKK